MARLVASVLAALLAVSSAGAAPTRVALPGFDESVVIPDGSPLAFQSFDKDSITVRFTGSIRLSGTYYYGSNVYEDATSDKAVYFKPNRASLERLPSFRQHGRPDDIFVTNPEAFRRAVVQSGDPPPRKSAPYATGHITIVVDRFEASIECDAPNFSARFVSVVKPAPVRFAAMPDTGC